MARRLLVTGYGGFVAGSVVRAACADWQVVAVARNGVADGPVEVECVCCDLRDTERLQRVFQRAEPDAVIHAAALANIDYCQSHPADAEEVNVGVTRVLARLCRASSAKLVFCSTAFRKRGYRPGQFPHAEHVGHCLVTLPINPRQTREAIDYLVDSIRALHHQSQSAAHAS